jgi:hypothetical protein
MTSNTEIKYKFIWDKLPNIPLFNYIFKNKQLDKQTTLYSCFKYPNDRHILKKTPQTLNIYYTGERFLDDLNSQLTIGFLPSNITYNQDDDTFTITDIKELITKSQPVQLINVNRGYRNKELMTIPFPLKSEPEKVYIQLRDQEREHLEYLIKQNHLDSSLFCMSSNSNPPYQTLLDNITLYKTLNQQWIDYGKTLTPENLYKFKPKFCCFIVSNPACWQRNEFFQMLNAIKPVDSMGRLFHNVDFIVPPRHDKKAYYELISQYRFMIVFENNALAWYHTEKIYNAFQSHTVPIYWGDPLITDTYSAQSFINVPSYENDSNKAKQLTAFKKCISFIEMLEDNPLKYIEYFQHSPVINAEAEDTRLTQSLYYLTKLN